MNIQVGSMCVASLIVFLPSYLWYFFSEPEDLSEAGNSNDDEAVKPMEKRQYVALSTLYCHGLCPYCTVVYRRRQTEKILYMSKSTPTKGVAVDK
jgi:hypothetical protein